MTERVRSRVEAVTTDTRDAVDAAREKISALATDSRASAETVVRNNAVLVGTLGLAIGAGIATTFATTALESEWVGEKAAAVRGSAEQLAGEVKERAQQVVSGVTEEVYAQGLTPGAAQAAVAGVADKIKTVGGAAREAVTQRLSGSSHS